MLGWVTKTQIENHNSTGLRTQTTGFMAFTAAEKWSGKLWKGEPQRRSARFCTGWLLNHAGMGTLQSNSDRTKMTSTEISAAAHHRKDRVWSLSPAKLTTHSKTKKPLERNITELSFYNISIIMSPKIIRHRRNRKMWPILKRKDYHQKSIINLILRLWN